MSQPAEWLAAGTRGSRPRPTNNTPYLQDTTGMLPAEAIYPIFLASLACVLVWAVVAAFTPPLHHLLKYHAIAIVVIAVSSELARRGYTRAGAALFSVCIWALTQLPPFVVGHLTIPGIVLPIVAVLGAGILWSGTAAMVLAVMSSLTWLGALWAESQGLLPAPQERTGFQFWLLLTEALFLTSVFVMITTRAMTKSLRSTQALMARTKRLVDQAPDAIITVDDSGVVRSANRATKRIAGLDPEELVGRSIFVPGLLSSEGVEEARAALIGVLSGDRLPPFETEILRGDGSVVALEALGHRVELDDGLGIEVILRDINHRRQADARREEAAEQLRMAQKMDAVGQLAGGVAHDFNNLLTVMGGCADLIEEDPEATDSILELARQIQDAQGQAADLTAHLLAFAQRQIVDVKAVSLAAEVSYRQALLRGLAGDAIELDIRVPSEDTTILADQHQLEQILVNLVSNARDAQQARGTVALRVERRSQPRPLSGAAGTVPPGEYVVLTVVDWGPGIPIELQERVLEPFFTTKEIGEGTGLGLSAILGIMRQCGGQLIIDSGSGRGTTVETWFPYQMPGTDADAGGMAKHEDLAL